MRILFVTGTLAEVALREVLSGLALKTGIAMEVAVLPITVAALMTPPWIARRLVVASGVDRVILPGSCRGDLSALEQALGVPVELGPTDLRDLPLHFGESSDARADYGAHDMEILAEINHAPTLTRDALLADARRFQAEGADVIDLGCTPGLPWDGIGDVTRLLKDQGFRVSVDSFDPNEVREATRAGAELVLSVNDSNREQAQDWGVEVVAIPDQPGTLDGLAETLEYLDAKRVRFRADPILEPIGFGFAASLGRYLEVRRLYPDASLMMGIGNLTELTEVDSAGVNAILVGFCQEVGVRSVLTTAVINWALSSVREIDIARRLMHYAVTRRRLPKHVEGGLVALRDSRLRRFGTVELKEIADRIKDPNWRLFAEDGNIVAMNGSGMLSGPDPFALFDSMNVESPSHAFYLGYEMMKARTALILSKNYRQDQALDWGLLTVEEQSHVENKRQAKRRKEVSE